MRPAVPLERPHLQSVVSQRIASLVLELISLEGKERDYVSLLERKATIENEIHWLQEVELEL